MQSVSLQLPQVGVHSMLSFLQEHLNVLQSVEQLHLFTHSRYSGAGSSNIRIGMNPLHALAISSLWDETLLLLILFILDLEGTREGCGTLLLMKLVEMIVDLLGMFIKPPFHQNILCRRESSVS